MREYNDKKYYKDRFFVKEETPKSEILGSKFEDDFKALSDFKITQSYVEFDNMVLYVLLDDVKSVLKILQEKGYKTLSELSGVDFNKSRGGIEVFYQILDIFRGRRARIKCFVPNKSFLPSVSDLYFSANWAERELYDMMGVWIKDHPNLKRILMPDDWYGHPLLKSYPLQGDEFAAWYEIDKIYGKAKRQEVAPENRNSAFIDEKDSFNFSRIYYESEFGGQIPASPSLQEYQENGGVPLVKKAKRSKFRLLKKRK